MEIYFFFPCLVVQYFYYMLLEAMVYKKKNLELGCSLKVLIF